MPDYKLTNEQLAKEFPDWNIEKIYKKTGISERYIVKQDECASDLGMAAAKKLFKSQVCAPDDIDFLIFCTQSPDYYLPTTACIIQDRLGLRTSCGALDINLGCSGFIYGLSLAKGLVETGSAENVLLITAETYTKYIHPTDRSIRTIFGDGAAATLISGVDSDDELIGPFVFGTDGSGANTLIVPAGGARLPISTDTAVIEDIGKGVYRSKQNLFMDGAEIFNFTIKTIPLTVKTLLEKSNITMDKVDYFVFHQANIFMLNHLRKKIGIPDSKFCINMESYGNTVSSTIPMALEIVINRQEIKNGDLVMLVGFGVGHSWGATLVKIHI